jgi:steroid 5-alpha reductase family enzyme
MSVLALLALALVLVTIVMGLVWWTSVRIRNAGIVDIAWSANFALLALLYAACGGSCSCSAACSRSASPATSTGA